MSNVWQIYVFCALELLGFFMSCTLIPFIPDPCKAEYGRKPCNAAETVLTNYNSIWVLWVAVLFFLLAWRNRESTEKTKRLSYFAIYCTVANLTSLLLVGSSNVAGLMKTWLHVTFVVISFLVFFMLAHAVNTDSPMVAATPVKENLGLNMKGFLVLYTIALLVWIIMNSDFQPIETVLNPDDMSKLARLSWNWWSVLVLQVSFVYMYSFVYGDEGDQEIVSIATIFLLVIATLIVWGVRTMESAGIVKFCIIQNSIWAGLALLAVIRYRVSGRSDYQSVSNPV